MHHRITLTFAALFVLIFGAWTPSRAQSALADETSDRFQAAPIRPDDPRVHPTKPPTSQRAVNAFPTEDCDPVEGDTCRQEIYDDGAPLKVAKPFKCRSASCPALSVDNDFDFLEEACHDSVYLDQAIVGAANCCTGRQRPCDDSYEARTEQSRNDLPPVSCLAYDVAGQTLHHAREDAGAGCTFFCGDGVRHTRGNDLIRGNADDEQCDDGNNTDGDGCSSTCKREAGVLKTSYHSGCGGPADSLMGSSLDAGGTRFNVSVTTVGAPGYNNFAGLVAHIESNCFIPFNAAGANAGDAAGSYVDQADINGDGHQNLSHCAGGAGYCEKVDTFNFVQDQFLTFGGGAAGSQRMVPDVDGDGKLDLVAVVHSIGGQQIKLFQSSDEAERWSYEVAGESIALNSDITVVAANTANGFTGDALIVGNSTGGLLGNGQVHTIDLDSGVEIRLIEDATQTSGLYGGSTITDGTTLWTVRPRFENESAQIYSYRLSDGAEQPVSTTLQELVTGFDGQRLFAHPRAAGIVGPEAYGGQGAYHLFSYNSGRWLGTQDGVWGAGQRPYRFCTAVEDVNNDGQADIVCASPDVTAAGAGAGIVDWYTVTDADLDEDGVLNDGDGSEVAGDGPCDPLVVVACDDNCMSVPNSNQEDQDANGIGDACDCPVFDCTPGCTNTGVVSTLCTPTDIDGDGIDNGMDLCSETLSDAMVDAQGCAEVDVDPDLDGYCSASAPSPGFGDCVPADNCGDTYNPDQEDLDGDGVGDLCDPDLDGDGVANIEDCSAFNPDLLLATTAGTSWQCGYTYNRQTDTIEVSCDEFDSLYGPATVMEIVVGDLEDLRTAAGDLGVGSCDYASEDESLEIAVSDLQAFRNEFFLALSTNDCTDPVPAFNDCPTP